MGKMGTDLVFLIYLTGTIPDHRLIPAGHPCRLFAESMDRRLSTCHATPAAENSAALLMKHLGQRYVQYNNRTDQRSGTLWQGRFRACLAQNRGYLLSCYRYIELNPLRAAMVTHPAQ